MINLTTAIYGKLSGSALENRISNRMFDGEAPEGTEYPYTVYKIISNFPEYTFSEHFENTIIQFSSFSNKSSQTEIKNIFTDLKTLYDECLMSVTGSTWFYWMKRVNALIIPENHTVKSGVIKVWHLAVDYEIRTLGLT